MVIICLPSLVAAQWLSADTFFSSQHATSLLIAIAGVGLSFIVFSREKQEDERVIAIRYAAYRITLSIFSIFLISAAGSTVFGYPFTFDPGILAASLLTLYIVVFHIGLYSNAASFYANCSAGDNFSAYRKQILLYLIPVTLLVLVGFGAMLYHL